MPIAKVNGIDINYEILDPKGSKETLLMIMGLSFSLLDWGTALPKLLADKYKVILFDNRDSGRSSNTSPLDFYTIKEMSDDAKGLLDELRVTSTYVFGVSMGGMIAQELALANPSLVKKLVLGCTFAGGSCSVAPNLSSFQLTSDPSNSGNADPALWKLLFTNSFISSNRPKLDAYWSKARPFHSKPLALGSQLVAIASHDTCDRLKDIKIPTLVITGDKDTLIPAGNSNIIQGKIPGSKLEIIKDAEHGFPFSHPDKTFNLLESFL